MPIALTIAGSDPTCGAGLGADLRTFAAHGAWGCAVPTLITVQSTRGVERVIPLAADLVAAQLDTLLADVAIHAWKTGALGSRAIVEVVAARAATLAAPLVVDPVLVSSSGAALLDDDARSALVKMLFPFAALVTPNAPEAALLTGREVRTLAQARDAARALLDLGARAVLLKGGHLEEGNGEREGGSVVDVLVIGDEVHELAGPRVTLPKRVHGTGCALSASIVARLARGEPLHDACRDAKEWLGRALAGAHAIGGGDWVLELLR